jgi:hypothetical protein
VSSRYTVLRLRFGLGLFVMSWLPIAQLWIWIGDLQGDGASELRAVIWSVQAVIGVIGLIIAGAAAKGAVKSVGWRRMPRALWAMLRTGEVPAPAPVIERSAQS